MEKIKDEIRLSPFSYQEGMTYLTKSANQYVGKDTLEREYRDGSIGELELILMQLFAELGTLTSHLVRLAMEHPDIPYRCKKMEASKDCVNNPYKKELKYFENMGVLLTGKVFLNGKELVKTYHISPFALEWSKKKPALTKTLYNIGITDNCKPTRGVLTLLTHLAAVNFHIRYVKDMRDSLNTWSFSNMDNPEKPFDAKYVYQDGSERLALSYRSTEASDDRIIKSVCANQVSATGFIFILDSKETMLSLRMKLIKYCKDIDEKALYITDSLIHSKEELKFYKINNNMIEIQMQS